MFFKSTKAALPGVTSEELGELLASAHPSGGDDVMTAFLGLSKQITRTLSPGERQFLGFCDSSQGLRH